MKLFATFLVFVAMAHTVVAEDSERVPGDVPGDDFKGEECTRIVGVADVCGDCAAAVLADIATNPGTRGDAVWERQRDEIYASGNCQFSSGNVSPEYDPATWKTRYLVEGHITTFPEDNCEKRGNVIACGTCKGLELAADRQREDMSIAEAVQDSMSEEALGDCEIIVEATEEEKKNQEADGGGRALQSSSCCAVGVINSKCLTGPCCLHSWNYGNQSGKQGIYPLSANCGYSSGQNGWVDNTVCASINQVQERASRVNAVVNNGGQAQVEMWCQGSRRFKSRIDRQPAVYGRCRCAVPTTVWLGW